jgi:hypothetical protein
MISRLTMACQQSFNRDLERGNLSDNQQIGDSSSGSISNVADDNPLVRLLGGWQLHRASECRLGRRLEGLENGLSASHWLQTYRKNDFAMDAMRRVLLQEGLSLQLSRLRDEDVIEQVAHILKGGRWHVCEPVMQVYKVIAAEEPAVMPVPRRGPAPSEPPPAVRDVPDADTLAGNADQNAIAGVLNNASDLGFPFCEECLRRALERGAARMATQQ